MGFHLKDPVQEQAVYVFLSLILVHIVYVRPVLGVRLFRVLTRTPCEPHTALCLVYFLLGNSTINDQLLPLQGSDTLFMYYQQDYT